MNEVELENLIVRLTGDSTQFVRMLEEAEQRVTRFGRTVTSSLAAVAELIGFKSSVTAFSDFQDNLTRIEAALESNGQAVDSTMQKYKAFARQLEETSRFSETAVTGLLAVASANKLFGEEAQKAVQAAINIAQYKGTSPQAIVGAISQYLRSQALAKETGQQESPYAVFRLASILGVGVGARGMGFGRGGGGREEGMAFLIKEINDQLRTADLAAQRLGVNFGGQMARIRSYLQDIAVAFGKIVAEWLKPFVDGLSNIVHWFKELDPAAQKVIVAFLALGTILTTAGPISRFFTLLMGLVTNISPITVALTAAAGATAIWVKAVGGLGNAWDIVYGKITEIANLGIRWITEFIDNNRRLVLAISLVAGVIGITVAAWLVLSTTLTVVSGLLSVLYIRQLAQITVTTLWSAAVLAANLVAGAFSLVLSGAGLLGGLLRTTAVLALQTAAWLAWNSILAISYIQTALVTAANATLIVGLSLARAAVLTLIVAWDTFRLTILAGSLVLQSVPILLNTIKLAFTVLMNVLYASGIVITGVVWAFDSLNRVTTTLTTVASFLPNLWRAFTISLGSTVNVLNDLWSTVSKVSSTIVHIFSDAWKVLSDTAGAIVISIKGFANAFTSVSLFGYSLSALTAAAATAFLNSVVSAGILIWTAYSGIVFLVNLAISLYTGVVAAATAAMTVFTAGIGTVAALFATAFVTAFTTAKTALSAFLDTLLSIPVQTGPLAAIGSIFREWGGILYDAYRAASLLPTAIKKIDVEVLGLKKDMSGMDLAWELLVAGFNLASAQVRALWPPLWEYVQTVANSAWQVIQAGWQAFVANITPPFKAAFTNLMQFLKQMFAETFAEIFNSLVRPIEGSALNPFNALQNQINSWAGRMYTTFNNMGERANNFLNPDKIKEQIRDIENQIKLFTSTERIRVPFPEGGGYTAMTAGLRMRELYPGALEQLQGRLENLKSQLREISSGYAGMATDQSKATDAIKNLNEELKRQMEIIAKAGEGFQGADNEEVRNARKRVDELRNLIGSAVQVQKEMEKQQEGINLGKPFESATKEIKKWEAALYGSSEAYTHWFDYIDRLNDWELKHSSINPYRMAANRQGPEELKNPNPIITPSQPGLGGGTGPAVTGKTADNTAVLVEIREAIRALEKTTQKDLPRDVNVINARGGGGISGMV